MIEARIARDGLSFVEHFRDAGDAMHWLDIVNEILDYTICTDKRLARRYFALLADSVRRNGGFNARLKWIASRKGELHARLSL